MRTSAIIVLRTTRELGNAKEVIVSSVSVHFPEGNEQPILLMLGSPTFDYSFSAGLMC
jgi:hypothetical protein